MRKTFPGFASGPIGSCSHAGGSPPRHLLSALLRCDCGAPIGISGGKGPSRSYACTAHKRNPALCSNALSISKVKIERSVIAALRRELSAPDLLARVARRLAENLHSKSSEAELRLARAALAKAEGKLANLLRLVETGELASSRAVADRVAAAEVGRDRAAAQVAAIERRPDRVKELPSPDAVRGYVDAFNRVLTSDVERGRDMLRLHVRTIKLTPNNDGPKPYYRASGRFVFSTQDPRVEGVAGARNCLNQSPLRRNARGSCRGRSASCSSGSDAQRLQVEMGSLAAPRTHQDGPWDAQTARPMSDMGAAFSLLLVRSTRSGRSSPCRCRPPRASGAQATQAPAVPSPVPLRAIPGRRRQPGNPRPSGAPR